MKRGSKPQRPASTLCYLVLVAVLAVGGTAAAEFRHFPGPTLDKRMLRIQEQVEELYRNEDYERAILIYEKDLAPVGDKYAQYMVGYMTLTGRGVAEDPVQAMAWYELAAERNESPFVQARNALAASLDDAESRRAAALYADLWRELGDRQLLLGQLQKDLGQATRYADDRANDTKVTVLASGFLNGPSPFDPYRQLRDRMEQRLAYLSSLPADDAAPADEIEAMKDAEAKIREGIANLPDY